MLEIIPIISKESVAIPCERNRVIQRNFTISKEIDPKEVVGGRSSLSLLQKKGRSIHYFHARNALRSVRDLGLDLNQYGDLNLVIKHFENWRSHYQTRFIHLEKDDHHKFLRSICRFDDEYRQSLRSRMRKMRDVNWSLKLEITLDPKQFMTLDNEFIILPRIWNTVNRWLNRTFGYFEFLRIMEITKKGRPHLHILVVFHDEKWNNYFRSMRRNDKQRRFQAFYHEFKEVVSRNGGGWIWVRPIQDNLKLVNYVMKYVNKSISGESNKKYSALLFASNKRLFSVSKGLRLFSEPKKPKQGYSYVGCVPASELKAYCESKGVPFGFRVDLEEVEYGDLYEYPLLFGEINVESRNRGDHG